MPAVGQIPSPRGRAGEAREQLVEQARLDQEDPAREQGGDALARRGRPLWATAGLDVGVPPVAQTHIAEPAQQAESQIGPGAEAGGKGGAGDADPVAEGELLAAGPAPEHLERRRARCPAVRSRKDPRAPPILSAVAREDGVVSGACAERPGADGEPYALASTVSLIVRLIKWSGGILSALPAPGLG